MAELVPREESVEMRCHITTIQWEALKGESSWLFHKAGRLSPVLW